MSLRYISLTSLELFRCISQGCQTSSNPFRNSSHFVFSSKNNHVLDRFPPSLVVFHSRDRSFALEYSPSIEILLLEQCLIIFFLGFPLDMPCLVTSIAQKARALTALVSQSSTNSSQRQLQYQIGML